MKKLFLIFLFLVIVLAIAVGYYFNNKGVLYESSALTANTEAEALAEEVGLLILLPLNETPTIATVSDPKALSKQAFFVDAQKGDKVLIYANAQKAILYNPTLGKIINVAPVNFGVDQKTFQPQIENRFNVNQNENTF